MSDNYTNWTVFLDGLEDEVKQAHAELDEGHVFNEALLQPWSPPQHLEALPLELLERAQTINKSLNELELRTEGRRLELKHEIKRVGMKKAQTSKAPSQYGDSVIPHYIDRSV